MDVIDNQKYKEEIKNIAKDVPIKACSVLVTGATGMIGSCIIDTLLEANKSFGNQIHIIGLGRNEDKLRKRFAYANQNWISFVVQDVTTPIVSNLYTNYIIHTASNADPVSYSLYPAETLLTNIYGVRNMLDYCKEHKETRLLMTSTFEAYGKIEGQDVYKEDDSGEIDLNAIRSCYPESKRCAEILMRCYQKEYNIDFVIARLSSIYGPTMGKNDSKAHAQFVRKGLAGDDILLKSKGIQRRTYCYIIDAVSGILTVLFKGKSGEAYNVSNENSIATIAEVAETVASICKTKISFDIPDETEQAGFSRPQNCILDNTKLKTLGWTGEYTLESGLKSTIDILREMKC